VSPEGPRNPDLEPQLEGRSVDEISFLLSSRRTRLSFQRTRMSTDRTLMSVVRTALSLIGFGFTIFQFFNTLRKSDAGQTMLRPEAPRNFGMALIILGVLLLTLGIIGHVRFMTEFRREHDTMVQERLIPHDHLPYSVTLLIAILLWFIGLVAIANGLMRAGPLG
jgi:putative membrane protein